MRLPERSRVYQNHHMDSTRWDYFERRPGDILIGTSYKAGTTWMQAIVAHLLFPDTELPAHVSEISPWLDTRTTPLEFALSNLAAQTHRRFLKTHLPLDGISYDPQMRYIYVARDARDVFMSLWNHYTKMIDEQYVLMNTLPGRVGDEFPKPTQDIHEFWSTWMTKGWFDWETDGWPYWSHLYNVQSWWQFRHLPNLILVHYSDMLEDLEREVRRIAEFLEIPLTDEQFAAVAQATTFSQMKQRGERYAPGGGDLWEGGASTFLHKGTNGRWREVLSDEELELYDAACRRTLGPACRKWMEEGGPA